MDVHYLDLSRIASELVEHLQPGSVVGISGELGAGKTTLVQAVANVLGVTGPVTSPTFAIVQEYPLEAGSKFDRLIHIDAYRIDEKSVHSTGISESLQEGRALVMIEWPEKVQSLMPDDAIQIRLTILDPMTRDMTIAPDLLTIKS